MKNINHFNRRDFVKFSSMAALGSLPMVSAAADFLTTSKLESELKVYIFSKTLQFLDYEEMSAVVKEIGFDGIDLTVRPKGHVLPENVAQDLPKATKAMHNAGLLTDMISTKVIDANNASDVKAVSYTHLTLPTNREV